MGRSLSMTLVCIWQPLHSGRQSKAQCQIPTDDLIDSTF